MTDEYAIELIRRAKKRFFEFDKVQRHSTEPSSYWRHRDGRRSIMKTIVITAIICLTIVAICWISKDRK